MQLSEEDFYSFLSRAFDAGIVVGSMYNSPDKQEEFKEQLRQGKEKFMQQLIKESNNGKENSP